MSPRADTHTLIRKNAKMVGSWLCIQGYIHGLCINTGTVYMHDESSVV